MGRKKLYTAEEAAQKNRDRAKRYYWQHRDEKREAYRESSRKYYHAHKEKCRELHRQWRLRNIEYYYDYADAYNHGMRITKAEWEQARRERGSA